MALTTGTRLGTYEITAAIGAGGMGEVFRARDTTLNRDVAIKVLPATMANDPERLARFKREAQALAALNHPNVAHVYGFESATLEDGAKAHFLAMEMVEGEDLAERLKRGAIPVDEAIVIAKQVAEGLEDAHEHGIIHRDLKPANIKVTPDGKVKILDFGLAKALEEGSAASSANSPLSHSPTMSRHMTEAGMIIGTAAYMSPEQARGKPLDRRTDIWSFGVVFFEILTGTRLFEGETVSDVLAAVLTREPDPGLLPAQTPLAVRQLLRRCLDRNPRNRLQAAGDARLALEETLAGHAEALPRDRGGATGGSRPSRRDLLVAVPALFAAGVGIGYVGRGRSAAPDREVTFERLTFRLGSFPNARFAPDGQTVFYSAAWEGSARELYQSRPQAGELPLGLKASLLSVSPAGELAVLLPRKFRSASAYDERGTLALVSASGGTPRDLADDVVGADFAPDGKTLAVIRRSGIASRIEFPMGKKVYQTEDEIKWPRVSQDGEKVAFFHLGKKISVMTVDRAGTTHVLSPGWSDWWNLSWSPDGREVWFGAARTGRAAELYAVDAQGQVRKLLTTPGTLEMHDTAKDGRALVARVSYRGHVFGGPRRGAERSLGHLESSTVADLSSDGHWLLLRGDSERSAGDSVVLRDMQGTAPLQLGAGLAQQLSADGKWALALRNSEVVALPTGAGEARSRDTRLAYVLAARFMPDGKILVASSGADSRVGFHLMDLERNTPLRAVGEPIHLRDSGRLALSPDGRLAAVARDEGGVGLIALDGTAAREVPGARDNELPIQWSSDGAKLYVFDPAEIPARVVAVDLRSGRREPWLELRPRDIAGVGGVARVVMTPDGLFYAYGYSSNTSDLYVVKGLR